MATNYAVVETTRCEYIDFGITNWTDTTHGYLTGPLGIVAALLTVRSPEPADALLGRWFGGHVTVAACDYSPVGGGPSLFERAELEFEDITPAVVVMFERLGIEPVRPSVVRELGEGRATFQRFARCALVTDYPPVGELLTSHVGDGWVDTFRAGCARLVDPDSVRARSGIPLKRFEGFPG